MSPEARENHNISRITTSVRNFAGVIRQGIDFVNSGVIYRFIIGQPDIKVPKGKKVLLPYFKPRDIAKNDKRKTSR
jgi:hypothetical protein